MKNKVEARFSSYPYLCVCERTTQLTQTLWDVDSRAKYIVEIQFPMDNSEIHTQKIVMLLTISFVTLVA